MFSARFDEQDEVYQVLDENEVHNYLNFNQILTESDVDKIDVSSQLEQ